MINPLLRGLSIIGTEITRQVSLARERFHYIRDIIRYSYCVSWFSCFKLHDKLKLLKESLIIYSTDINLSIVGSGCARA